MQSIQHIKPKNAIASEREYMPPPITRRSQHKRTRAFTLIELSIVLVVIGLLIAGILTGRTLIRQSELQSVLVDIRSFSSAANTYRDKHGCIPGDCKDAETVWGSDAGCPHTPYTPAPHTATCNGDGDGFVGQMNAAGAQDNYEIFRFWQQLANAHLIQGNYNGISGTGNAYYQYALIGINVPASRISNAGYSIYNVNNGAAYYPGSYYPASIGNVFIFGAQWDAVYATPAMPVLSGGEAMNLDLKIDDGKPAFGRVMTLVPGGAPGNCSSSASAANAVYNSTDNTIRCQLIFATGF